MKKIFTIILCKLSVLGCAQKSQEHTPGTLQRIESFQSEYITARHVDVWLPEGYREDKKYAVLYMHDGQMLFDETTTWNKQAWNIDDVATTLIRENKVQEFIVVGVWNGGETRHADYFPEKPFEALSPIEKEYVRAMLREAGRTEQDFQPNSDNYLLFLVNELKPYIDKNFSVYTQPDQTFIAGSSMGGLISLYAICEYPEVFGGAACLSTHWPGIFNVENNPVPDAFANYLSAHLPDPHSHKIYFDYGDQTLDAFYPPLQEKMDEVLRAHGFTEETWVTRFFPGDDHSENAWHGRLHIPLEFLLGTSEE
ncbi:MAG: alpha/beta hydrolase [Bacteroidota bacterium]